MITVNANVQFDAEDRADAEAKMATWRLHDGCVIQTHLSEVMDIQETLEGSDGEMTRQPTIEERMEEEQARLEEENAAAEQARLDAEQAAQEETNETGD